MCGKAAAHRPFTAGIPPPATAYTLTETDRERSTLHMELKIFRDTLPQGGAGCTVKAELPLETDIRISDDLPPVGKLVKCFVRPVVLQRQLQPGRLTLEGYLRCTVFYQSEAEKDLCQTEQKLPLTRQLDLTALPFTTWTAVVEGQTEYLNTRAADPRRIEVRGAYGLVVTVHTQCKTEVITALADGGIEQQLRTLQGVRSVAVLDKLVTLEGELVFAKPPAAVLDITGNACVAEVKLLAGKAVVKGELRVQCAWRAEGDTALQSQAAALPFQQVIDLEGITEDCHCLCVAEPVGFTLSQAESAAAQLTANVMLHLRAWRSYQLQVAVDAFSTRFETELTPQPLVTEQLLCTLNDTATATGSGPLPDAGAQLRACFVHYGPQQTVQKGEGWVLAAKAVVTALAENTLGELESYEKTLEVAVPLPITSPEGTVLVSECWLSTENVQCTCAGGTLEATITVRAEGTILGCTTSPVIGRPSQACEAMEMGAAAIMANTGLATAGNLPLMAQAFRKAIEAGRAAYLSGLGRVRETASASDPLTGFLGD